MVQRWVAINGGPPDPEVASVTAHRVKGRVPKFALLNRLMKPAHCLTHDFLIVCDDDIELPTPDFLDAFLGAQERLDLALAQPARTLDSYCDHNIVYQHSGAKGRQTRFVEIGPLFSIRFDLAPFMLPFDLTSPMGWGYDFVWPKIVEARGLKMGIVDSTPVAHRLREPVANYDFTHTFAEMESFLAKNAHLSREEAFQVVKTYPAD